MVVKGEMHKLENVTLLGQIKRPAGSDRAGGRDCPRNTRNDAKKYWENNRTHGTGG
jgi:hypothetical protein